MDTGDGDVNKRLFDALSTASGTIETELAESLEWERLDNKQACRISAVRDGSIDCDQQSLDDIQEWMVDRLLAFKRVFTPHLRDLVE